MLRISLVTLGVKNVPAATRFYEALGLVKSRISGESVAFFQLGPTVLALFGRDAAEEDGNASSVWAGNGGFALAQNVGTEAEVNAIIAAAAAAGATILKEPQKAFWGGYHGFFADPDGHVWEVAHNPGFTLDASGVVVLP
jgi:catechol 2,3-dioxygenase-like lactoylglutathione lyase family enzyme